MLLKFALMGAVAGQQMGALIGEDIGEARPLDKCSGCMVIMDTVWQGITKAVPLIGKTRSEADILDIWDRICNGFDSYQAQDAGDSGYMWYRRTDALTADGRVLLAYCNRLLEKYEDPLVEYMRTMKESRTIQQDLCVEMAGACDKDTLVPYAKAVVAHQMELRKQRLAGTAPEATQPAQTNTEKKRKKSKKKKKSKQKKRDDL